MRGRGRVRATTRAGFDHDRVRRAGSSEDRGCSGRGDAVERDRRTDDAGSLAMIAFPSGARVWLATGHTDMRRGFHSLALLVQESLKRDPHICVGRGYVAAWS